MKNKVSNKSMDLTYEQAMEKLEQLVQSLEEGNLTLEESLATFEKAVSLIAYCRRLLTNVEKRISVLTRDEEGQLIEIPWVEGQESED
jgi:exodeoxyribonuclease VII small subunit